MSNTLLDHSSRREITSPVSIGGVDGEEPHVVSFGADDECKLGLVVRSTDGSSSLSESLQFLSIRQLITQENEGRRAYSTTWAYCPSETPSRNITTLLGSLPVVFWNMA